jgi:hypothetical protein
MPFGLKNAGATYQRAMNSIFHDFIEVFMQIYIDDIVVKSPSTVFCVSTRGELPLKGESAVDFSS